MAAGEATTARSTSWSSSRPRKVEPGGTLGRMGQWRALHERANRQRFITRSDVRDFDLAETSFGEHAHGLGWSPLYRDLWVPPGIEWEYIHGVRAAAHVLGESSMATGATALHLEGILDVAPHAVEMLVAAPRSPAKRDGICVHHTLTFDDVRSHFRQDVRVAAVPRAIADYAAHEGVAAVCRVIATADRLRLCTIGQLRHELGLRKRFPGRRNLRIALAMVAGELVHSGVERLARQLIRDAGYKPHPRPYRVDGDDGRPIAEIDVAFPAILYGVEVDGPRHLLPEVASHDRARDRRLVGIDWTIDRFWWDEIEQRKTWFVQEVTAQLARRGLRPAPTPPPGL